MRGDEEIRIKKFDQMSDWKRGGDERVQCRMKGDEKLRMRNGVRRWFAEKLG